MFSSNLVKEFLAGNISLFLLVFWQLCLCFVQFLLRHHQLSFELLQLELLHYVLLCLLLEESLHLHDSFLFLFTVLRHLLVLLLQLLALGRLLVGLRLRDLGLLAQLLDDLVFLHQLFVQGIDLLRVLGFQRRLLLFELLLGLSNLLLCLFGRFLIVCSNLCSHLKVFLGGI